MPVVSYNKGVPKFTSDLGRIKVSRLVFHNVELNTCEIILHSKYLDNQKSRFHFAFPVLHCIIFDDTPVPCLKFFLTTYISRHISYPLKIELNTYSMSPSFSIHIILSICIDLHPWTTTNNQHQLKILKSSTHPSALEAFQGCKQGFCVHY